jgi:hypothetical protein
MVLLYWSLFILVFGFILLGFLVFYIKSLLSDFQGNLWIKPQIYGFTGGQSDPLLFILNNGLKFIIKNVLTSFCHSTSINYLCLPIMWWNYFKIICFATTHFNLSGTIFLLDLKSSDSLKIFKQLYNILLVSVKNHNIFYKVNH